VLRDEDPPLCVEHALVSAADVHRLEPLDRRIEAALREDLGLELFPCADGVDVETPTIALAKTGDHESLLVEAGKRFTVLGRDGHTIFVVGPVLERACESVHPAKKVELGPSTTHPHSPTTSTQFTPPERLLLLWRLRCQDVFAPPKRFRANPWDSRVCVRRAVRRRRSVSRIL